MSNSKCVYYKEKEQKSIDGGITWVDTGNFRKGALISTQASQCGSFVTEYRWTKTDYVCDNANKYKGYKQQVSHDNGGSWTDTGVVNIGDLISSNSKDCGYDEQWFVMTGDKDFICDGASKYKKKEMKYTRDSGTTWNSFDTPRYEKGDLIEETSSDCASMKVTYTDGTTKIFTGLTSIDEYTDSNKSNAKKVEIYDGVTSIGDWAFGDCSHLTDIAIPNSVTRIADGAFSQCSSLTGITIPNSVTIIGYEAFTDCSSLTGITIPNSVTHIGNRAFIYCHKLTEVTVQATTPPSLGSLAFYNSNIQTIYVPADSLDAYKTANDWKDYADKIFAIGTRLSMKVTYVDGTSKTFYNLKTIGKDTDANKKNAKSVIILDGVRIIEEYAFSGCTNLTSIALSNSIISIGYEAFSDCSSLTGITIPNSVEKIEHYAFSKNNSIKTITIPDSVIFLGDGAFFNCSGLTEAIIGNSVTEHLGAFEWCYSLKSLTIGNNIKNIYDFAFNSHPDLTKVTIGTGVTSISDNAFADCPKLATMTIKATTPPQLVDGAFSNTNIETIYVPASSVNAYKSATNWSNYASKIKAIP